MFEELDNSAYVDEIRHLEAKVKQFEDQYNKLQDRCRIHFDENITEQLFFYINIKKVFHVNYNFFCTDIALEARFEEATRPPPPPPPPPPPSLTTKSKG